LGADNDDHGSLTAMALERIALALALYETAARLGHPPLILATGGFGAHFNRTSTPHNHYVRCRLVEGGVPASSVVTKGLESANTVEDAVLVKRYLGDARHHSLLVVTSAFHKKRAELIFKAVMPEAELGVAADTRLPSPRGDHEARSCQEIMARGFIYHGQDRYPLKLKSPCGVTPGPEPG
jgi:uncharacterized SAM-binding protein YcdF (DUF218 family)